MGHVTSRCLKNRQSISVGRFGGNGLQQSTGVSHHTDKPRFIALYDEAWAMARSNGSAVHRACPLLPFHSPWVVLMEWRAASVFVKASGIRLFPFKAAGHAHFKLLNFVLLQFNSVYALS